MPRAIWSGSLSFGLVNVPVKVVSAVRSKDVKFNMLHEKDGGRIDMRRFCTLEDKEVPYEEIAKGYPVGPDEYVMVTEEDMKSVAAQKSETIEILDFVDITEIDPIYYEKPYYLVPQKGAGKAYGLLVEAMRRQGRVAIAKVVMRQKESLVAVRVIEDVLAMETMVFHDEVVPMSELEVQAVKAGPSEREIEMAEKLIESLTTAFKPDKYTDEYRARVLEMIEAKAEGKTYVSPAPAEEKRPTDLVEALKASLEAAKRKDRGGPAEA